MSISRRVASASLSDTTPAGTAHFGPAATRWLRRPEGRIAYDVAGSGPLVVCVPGMGDLRSSYCHLVPHLAADGYRVATLDLRGHGDSDTGFARHDGVAHGCDVLALIEHLGADRAVLVGSSLGAAAVTWAAAEAPGRVAALVLLGPFVRDVPVKPWQRLALRVGLLRPWGPGVWDAFYGRLYPGRPPADLAEHRARIRASLRRREYWRSFVATTRVSHAPVEARLPEVAAPALVVMGGRDPDFPDPVAEAELVAARLGADVVTVPDAGHYPHAEYPEIVAPAVRAFLRRALRRA